MPETSLRAYGREIDELIERERLDEAIAHCRYILQTYPKHLETYRHLGKAYLEAKRYGDAADIFQRVLSAVPDDFVSHVGMAIVREDEGNLDAAIWHMERAFETNPSNPAIQQEMKRLISRRDGLEPHKVRLTRGALARMYAHGELFAQAITELRSALQEEAERPDLQVLLVSMYWQTDQRSDATSLSNQILEKLPYCAEANRILAANLQASDRVEEAAVYHRRLANLDPYAAFVESALADSKSVEDSAVSLEKLDWVAGEPLPSSAPGQPGWATTLGMEMQEGSADDVPESAELPQTGPLPSWLEPGEPPPFEATAEKELRAEMENQAADDLPEAGFLDDLEAETADETESYGADDPGELSESEFLDGVKAEASADEDFSEPEPEEKDSERLGFAGAAAGIVAGVLGKGDKEDTEAIEDTETDIGEPDGALKDDIPDWMQEAGWGESKGEFKDAPVSFSDHELQSLDAGEIPAEGAAEDEVELAPAELPDWIHDIAPEDSDDGAGDESLPDWIGAEAPSDDEPVVDAAPPVVEVEAGDETEASVPAAESDTGEIPTWITSDPPGATESIVTWLEDRGPDSQEEDTAASGDLPDWMRDTGPLDDSLDSAQIVEQEDVTSPAELPMEATVDAEGDAPPAESPMVSESQEEPGSDSPASDSWLSAVAAVAAEDEASPQEEASEAPDWLSEAKDTRGDSDSDEIGTGVGLTAAAAAGMMASKDEEEAATEDSLDEALGLDMEVTSTDREVQASEAEVIDESEAPEQDLAAQFGPSDSSSAPDWLEEIGTLPEQPMQTDSADWLEGLEIDGQESPAEPAPDTPDWLKGLAEEGADGDESGAAPAADWLREIGEPGSVSEEQSAEVGDQPTQDEPAEPVEAAASGAAPDWLQGVGSEQAQAPPDATLESDKLEVETPPAPAEEDSEVMDWLHDLAAKQAEAPDDEELEATPLVEAAAPVLEDRDIPDAPEEGLEWLEQLADQRGLDVDVRVPSQEASPPSAPEPESEPESETAPGWLERMATQPIPKVDMEALEAAARGEEVSPDAETIDALAADVQAQLDEVALERETDIERSEDSAEVAPDDITIEARAGDLQAEIEQGEDSVEPVSSPGEGDSEEEIPDWLIAAAEQAEPPSDAPTGLPAEFVEETTDELEVAQEPADSDEQEIIAEAGQPPEPDIVEEMETVDIEAEPQAEPPEEAVVEAELPEVGEPADLATADEVEEPDDSETARVETAEEAEPVSETKKKEDLLERARQALASGDSPSATEMYGDLVKRKESLDSVIEDLRIAVDRTPDNADLWQVLGDAYMRGDQTDEAIDAYRKGMEAA